jgi:hypothetical protein
VDGDTALTIVITMPPSRMAADSKITRRLPLPRGRRPATW